jgi:hypothetical protein
MNNELEKIWKEAVAVHLKYFPEHFLDGLKKTTITSVKIAGVPAEIRTE